MVASKAYRKRKEMKVVRAYTGTFDWHKSLVQREEPHLSNIEIDAPLVDGRLKPYHEDGGTCWDAVNALIGNDFGTPPTSLNFTIQTLSGKTVKFVIPYDHTAVAKVYIDDKIV